MNIKELFLKDKTELAAFGLITIESFTNDLDNKEFVYEFAAYRNGELFLRVKGIRFRHADPLNKPDFEIAAASLYNAFLKACKRKLLETEQAELRILKPQLITHADVKKIMRMNLTWGGYDYSVHGWDGCAQKILDLFYGKD